MLRHNIIEDVQEFYRENYNTEITETEIYNLPLATVLTAYLNWNGVFGYTGDILNILNNIKDYKEDLE